MVWEGEFLQLVSRFFDFFVKRALLASVIFAALKWDVRAPVTTGVPLPPPVVDDCPVALVEAISVA